jgi:microcystin-dependent protein
MAEPDQLDFSTAANARWGVVEGCLVTVSGTTASMTPGVAIVNGVLVQATTDQQQPLGQGGSQDRFDLLAINGAGALVVILGTPATDPVFPDVPIDNTLLAAVFCPTGASDFLSNVIDKRRFLSKALLTKVLPGADLIRNLNGSGNYFQVLGDGTIVWGGDTKAYRSDVKTLKIEDHLQVAGNLAVNGNETIGGSLAATGVITGQNLAMGANPPAANTVPLGSLFQKTNGKLFLNTPTGWLELATLDGMLPTGTIITSVETPGVMKLKGWAQLNGDIISEVEWPTLFGLAAFASIDKPGTPGQRSMRLPDARGRMLMGTDISPGSVGGTSNNQITLKTDQLPLHNHRVRIANGGGATPSGRVAGGGRHTHTVGQSGRHKHDLTDPGHKHAGGDNPAAGSFVCLFWGGNNKIDALFNDRNHTYSVEAVEWSKPAITGVIISDNDTSLHDHTVAEAADHDHALVMDPIPEHGHSVLQDDIGLGSVIDITPAYIGLYVYIRS